MFLSPCWGDWRNNCSAIQLPLYHRKGANTPLWYYKWYYYGTIWDLCANLDENNYLDLKDNCNALFSAVLFIFAVYAIKWMKWVLTVVSVNIWSNVLIKLFWTFIYSALRMQQIALHQHPLNKTQFLEDKEKIRAVEKKTVTKSMQRDTDETFHIIEI